MPGENRSPVFTPTEKAALFNATAATDTDFLAAGLVPSLAPSLFRIMVAPLATCKLSVSIVVGGATDTVFLNSGANLVANSLYMFDMLTSPYDQAINFQVDRATTIRVFRVQEIYAATI